MKMGLSPYGEEDRSGKLNQCIEAMEPEFLIPIHYRTDRNADPYGTWPPDVTDVSAFIEWIRQKVGTRTRILPFTAGIEYEIDLPSKQVAWKWDWHKTWSDPPWRH